MRAFELEADFDLRRSPALYTIDLNCIVSMLKMTASAGWVVNLCDGNYLQLTEAEYDRMLREWKEG